MAPGLSQRGRIQFSLKNVFIHIKGEQPASRQYKALSYVWGDQSVRKTIEVDGTEHGVGENLWTFLNYARLNYPHVSIWIDALCINQADSSERNHQVKHMGTIYSQALEVLVWLGPGSERFDQFFDIATEYSRLFPSKDLREHRHSILVDVCRQQNNPRTLWDWNEILDGLHRLEYWSRAWTQQEFILARSVLLLSGSSAIEFGILWKALDALSQELGTYEEEGFTLFDMTGYSRLQTTDWQTHRAKIHDSSPWACIYNTEALGCADLRDHIYSQMSLIRGGDRFDVDYDECPYRLFLRTIFFFREALPKHKIFEHLAIVAKSLDQHLVCVFDELRLRACTMKPYRKLLTLFTTTGISFDCSRHHWPEPKTKDEAYPVDFTKKCPDCGRSINSSLRSDKFTQFCCLDPQGLPFHLSFVPSSNVCVDDPDSRKLIYHGLFLQGTCEQRDPVHTTSGVYLNLATCLLILQRAMLDMDISKVQKLHRDENELRILGRLGTMRSDCCELHRSLRSNVLVFEPDDHELAQRIPAFKIPWSVDHG